MAFGFDSTAEQVTEGLDLSGRTYLVTGVNSGLGKETARVLTLRGARIIGLARTQDESAVGPGRARCGRRRCGVRAVGPRFRAVLPSSRSVIWALWTG